MSPERAAAAAGEPTKVSALGWVRIVLRLLGLFLALLVCVPLHYLYRVIAYGSPFPKLFLGIAARICGARVRTVGTALRRDVVFLSNHVSWMDILAQAGASGTAFVAKAELKKAPIVGWLADLNRTVYVKRQDRMNVAGQINAVREAMADAWSVTIFPEGTTTDGHSLLPFKTSMLKMLEPPPPGVMVQPVVIDYGDMAEWIGWIGEESGLNNFKRVLARRGSFPVCLYYLEPFWPSEEGNRKTIAARARERIEAKLLETLGKPLRDYAHDVEPIRYSGTKAPPDDPPT
ncbi:lysophospholipid acyltransferase family protein [Aurantiacibacter poecillastricola]|uniref:lysophospholipid acyltransferase family protein n=1 Tax=Aurantiacibacter poecillastricola TaxID=3064385 RepID=UPI00273FC49A|nr:lysophospholipid acyltransferase family protein [Aurantiacibacter sp. 219JJ12-13]MDP5261537.1 lysophospholipid acyltransferase family protein [Aurantiacibacter sp. 219JJ12-13]